jgi:hypothetical protein
MPRTKRPENQYKLVSLNFDVQLWKRIKMRALEEDRTVTAILHELVRGYLDRDRPKPKGVK